METFRAYIKTGDEKLRKRTLPTIAKMSSCSANELKLASR